VRISVHPSAEAASAAAADELTGWLAEPGTRTLMVAGGNSPLALYRRIADRALDLAGLEVFVLDEYVGVPEDDPRTCSNLLRRAVAEAWGIPPERFHPISSDPARALASAEEQERLVAAAGGLDAIVLGVGRNGHLGFNEPGSAASSTARVVELQPTSVEANRAWFGGDYAPDRGVTVGLRTVLAARRALVLAFGAHKAAAVAALAEGPVGEACPASFLQRHPEALLVLDEAAAAGLRRRDG
jgi:glucosamine-6-phosphate deaminase